MNDAAACLTTVVQYNASATYALTSLVGVCNKRDEIKVRTIFGDVDRVGGRSLVARATARPSSTEYRNLAD
jgi:hypothetical protein